MTQSSRRSLKKLTVRIASITLALAFILPLATPAFAQRRDNFYRGARHHRVYDDRYDRRHHDGGIGPGKGALIGGGAGAALGAIFGGGAKGALIGGAAGAGVGALAGKANQDSRDRRDYRERYDRYGRPY